MIARFKYFFNLDIIKCIKKKLFESFITFQNKIIINIKTIFIKFDK